MSAALSRSALLLRAGERTCALHLPDVLEIMHPLPVAAVASAPAFVEGLSMIRGAPTPVVSLASLLASPGGSATRFVVVRAGERRVALTVDEVLGVFELDPATLHALPPLVQTAAGAVEAVGALDAQLLLVLSSGRIVPDEVWQELALPKL
ncbi:MAG: chemotaxis protein CheW [Acidobacteriia bacterium]|nr:chemotaxis protein CheW [Terriglobia bacterium]